MDYNNSFQISAAGMSIERLRADVAAMNLANAHTSHHGGVAPYKPLRVVIDKSQSINTNNFEQHMLSMTSSFPAVSATPYSVSVKSLTLPPRLALEPGHPDADSRGYVAYPNINVVSEMVSLMTATRAYQANVSAINAAKTMALKTLEIGGNR